MIPCPFSEMDRTSAYAKACVLGDVGALPELRALCKRKEYLLVRILFIGLPEVSVTADCGPGSGTFKWIVQCELAFLGKSLRCKGSPGSAFLSQCFYSGIQKGEASVLTVKYKRGKGHIGRERGEEKCAITALL